MIIEDGRTHFYQWDKDQRILINGFPSGTEVHFSLKPDHICAAVGNDNLIAKIAIAYSENDTIYADIPNLLLQMPGTLQIYIYTHRGSEAHTVTEAQIPVIGRPRPDDYIYTEAELKYWEALEAQLLHPISAEGTEMTVPVGADSEGKLWTYPTSIVVDTQLSELSTNPIANCTVAGIAAMANATFAEIGEMLSAYGEAIDALGEELAHKMDAPLPGDINGDGVVDNTDVELFRQYLSGLDVAIVDTNADVDGNGELNMQDVAKIQQHLLGVDVTLTPSPIATHAYVKDYVDRYITEALGGDY